MKTRKPIPATLTVQTIPSEHVEYPQWITACLRDKLTNVHIASVGNVDRFFEGDALAHCTELAHRWNVHEELLAALQAVVAALTQNATFPADIELARNVARAAIAKAVQP